MSGKSQGNQGMNPDFPYKIAFVFAFVFAFRIRVRIRIRSPPNSPVATVKENGSSGTGVFLVFKSEHLIGRNE